MLTHEEMIGIQAEHHDLIRNNDFKTKEEYILHLIHSYSYLEISKITKGKKVLDFGCNTGYGSEIISRTAERIVGVDVSETAISVAKKEYGNLDIEFLLIDGKSLPFDDNEFDVIISCQVIEHIVDYKIYLTELKRVLSKSGVVFFTTPNSLMRLYEGMKPWNKFHVREFDYKNLKELLDQYFLEVKILGLFAEKSLYMIEKKRLDKTRKTARILQQPNSIKRFVQNLLRRLNPSCIFEKSIEKLNKILKIDKKVDENFIKKYGPKDLYYKSSNLEITLDLLAICSEDKITVNDVYDKLND